jgi:16S rRNA (guanine527-N7)-methyltransferase
LNEQEKYESLQRVTGGVSRETYQQLLELERFFLKWAQTINLVAPSTLDQVWTRHILDSAQLWMIRGETSSWLDLGSGSGFPGLVLATLSKEAGSRTTLVESNSKKSTYLRQAIRHLSLHADVITKRVEELPSETFQRSGRTTTARAFAPLDRILTWTNGLGSSRSRALLHKGRGFHAEVAEARGTWDFVLVEHPSLLDLDSVVLDITGIRKL